MKLKKHKSTFHKLDFNPQTKHSPEPLAASAKSSKDVDSKNSKLKIRIFQCEKCKLAFNDEYMLKIHQLLDLRCVDSPAQERFRLNEDNETMNEDEGPVDVTEYVISVQQKQVYFEKDSNGRYNCPENTCEYTTKRRDYFIHHYCTHTDERPFQCKLCGRGFIQKTDCIKHIRIHDDRYKFKCSMCDKSFASKYTRKRHFDQLHFVE